LGGFLLGMMKEDRTLAGQNNQNRTVFPL